MTDPEILKTSFNINSKTDLILKDNNITRAWRAAYDVYGGVYDTLETRIETKALKFEDDLPKADDSDDEMNDSSERSLQTLNSNDSAITCASQLLFPKSNIRMMESDQAKDILKRRFTTIFKIRLPSVITDNIEEAGIDAAESFGEILEIFFSIDQQLIVEPWWDNDTTKCLGKEDEPPTCKQELLKYVDKCFLQKDSYPYIRIITRHNRKSSRFITPEINEKYKSHSTYVSIAKIQQKQTICIGWLMGTHPKSVNAGDLEEQIKSFKFQEELDNNLKNPEFDIELRMQAIRINKDENIDWKTATQASHVHVAAKNRRTAFSRILRIFSKHNDVGFPLGQEIWFVPNVIDQRIPTPKSRIANAAKMRERQRIFTQVSEIIPTHDIAALDTPIKDSNGMYITL